MEHSKLTWEDIIRYEEIKGYGQVVWRHQGQYYFVTEEGGVAAKRVVYELPNELFQLLENGERTLSEIHFKLQEDCWPATEEEKRLSDKEFVEETPTALITDHTSWDLFTQEELEELIPIGEKLFIEWKGKLPDDYVSPIE